MQLYNQTPFSAEQMLLLDENGSDVLVVVVKATYKLSENSISIDDNQRPVLLVDEYYGDPGKSSLKYESETAFFKPGTDVVFIGHAYAPDETTVHLDVSLKAGKLQKNITVFGDRYWDKIFGIWFISDPKPFEKMPIQYERSFGGCCMDDQNKPIDFYVKNPVGTGYSAVKNKSERKNTLLPNLEDPNCLISSPCDLPKLAGFGFIAPNWSYRLKLSGTYDSQWEKNRMPLLPEDFNRKYFNSAHPDLISQEFFKGGEPIELINLTPNGRSQFTLPEIELLITVKMKHSEVIQQKLNMDTILINTDENIVMITWRNYLNIHNKMNHVLWTKIQMV